MKHARSDWGGIQETRLPAQEWATADPEPHTGISSILADEPVFMVRAKDPYSADTMRAWAALAADGGADEALVRHALAWADYMDAYRRLNFTADEVHVPTAEHLTPIEPLR